MSNKPIIIDGVDVNRCVNFRDDVYTDKQINNACSIGLWQRYYSGLEESCKMSCECKNNTNCHFKQLGRAQQECINQYKQIKFLQDQNKSILFLTILYMMPINTSTESNFIQNVKTLCDTVLKDIDIEEVKKLRKLIEEKQKKTNN